ncbi:Serpentine receptor class r-10 [Caenorhabditis elegans]|uniref:Serpentine receptor class r-10 n=1 Tax=Caenorhabditis elegans TaxID=6239 RepID=Q86DA3_CAEEL|nr:Seven TM Receptor [Caenorhabditis elegans]CAD90179.1 Seven TM Receptor [Caenorhabditis elegans]|eukprot:NP_001023998.1 Seven TM Receptor [Caenorhabditis elegans]
MLKVTFSIISCYLNAFVAVFSNSILIFLIITKTPRSMGNYRFLMLIFSIFGIIFAFIDGTNQPMLHFYNGAYVIFSRNVLGLPRQISFWYIALNCACYGMIMLLLVYHFLYRFLAVCHPTRLKIFSYPYFSILVLIFILISAGWLILAIHVAGENPVVDEHIRDTMLINFDLTRFDYTYASSLFYRKNPVTKEEYASIPDFLFLLNLGLIIGTGFSIVIYCWFKLRKELLNSAGQIQNLSQRTLDMQRQLFRSLVAQTLFPVFLMFIPAGILLCFPIFKTNMGPIEIIILPLITTQPFMDALVPMYFIKIYRMAILKFFCRSKYDTRVHGVLSLAMDNSGTRGNSTKNVSLKI